MAVKIRLKRMGKVRTPFYRIVAVDGRKKRDGRVLEELGTYNPKTNPSTIHVDSERALYWLGVGAQPTEPVAALLKVTGDWQRFKGEPQPEPMLVPEPKRDKTEVFNEALKDAQGEPRTEAVSAKKTAKSSAKKAASGDTASGDAPEDTKTASDATDADATEAEESKAEESKAEESKAESSEPAGREHAEAKADDASDDATTRES